MRDRFSPGFFDFLEPFTPEEVEQHAGSILGLWPDLRLAYFNPASLQFARDNGGDPSVILEKFLGTSVLELVPDVMKPFHRQLLLSCIHQSWKTRKPVQHRYECSSPDLFREYVMTLYRLRKGRGLLVVHSLVRENPHDPARRPPEQPGDRYVDASGFIHQCAHCRRVRNLGQESRWDWVPGWVERPAPRTSHTFCPLCVSYYYAETDDDDDLR